MYPDKANKLIIQTNSFMNVSFVDIIGHRVIHAHVGISEFILSTCLLKMA